MLTKPIKHIHPHPSVDRRKHTRYNLRSGTYAGCSPNVGQIVDISLGGVAFNYVEFGGAGSIESNFIICGEDGCCLDDFSFTLVSDRVCHNTSALSHIVTRKRRIKFVDLTDEQTVMLQDFININRAGD